MGGAGNGKSFLAKKVASAVKGCRIGEASEFSSRQYDYDLDNGSYLRIVNDATIPPRESLDTTHYLTNDVQFCIQKKSHLLACVNRGVLIAESQRDSSKTSSRIVNSLLEMTTDSAGGGPVERRGHLYFEREVELENSIVADVHVVFMDQCSLFEPFPAAQSRKRPKIRNRRK